MLRVWHQWEARFELCVSYFPSCMALALCLAVWCARTLKTTLPLPPGPRGLPIIGNALQLPNDYHEYEFSEWSDQYGDIAFVKFFRTPAIIIGSAQIAKDLMEKRSNIYSDRPNLVYIREMLGYKYELPFIRYGPRFRQIRKWFHDVFEVKAALHKYEPLQRREALVVLDNLLEKPEGYVAHFNRSSIILEVIYGHRVTSDNDRFMLRAREAIYALSHAGSPGSHVVDFFPFLRYYPEWLPGAGFKHTAKKIHDMRAVMMDPPHRSVKSQVVTNTMTTFMLAMVLHPDVLRKAQDEIDRVLGSRRLPRLDDRPSLPYLECVIKEVYRWRPAVPMTIHASTRDDEYEGYRIPSGSTLVVNIWRMSQDRNMYPSPEKFNPERFVGAPDDHDPRHYMFGFGRRICPGQYFADSSVFLVLASLTATMDISKARDESGRPITPPVEFISGISTQPKPFRCTITPRSKQVVDLIRG
ncbi:hypothetical protein EIP91_007557 [Steccherinum ochraceum]|uniref:Cytochrome P450 n=1 Tax=Steccherinum ochraceum TaxID=92696 RepID=A0A4R0RQI7_9APHY|nr:hypothetical protein EIP91_007557 [Steccherinum ochraceum]